MTCVIEQSFYPSRSLPCLGEEVEENVISGVHDDGRYFRYWEIEKTLADVYVLPRLKRRL